MCILVKPSQWAKAPAAINSTDPSSGMTLFLHPKRSFLLSVETTIAETDATTTSNPLLDENGQFEDVPTALNNVVEWLDSLQIIEKFYAKLPTIIIASILIVAGYFIAKFAKKLVVKAMRARNVDPSVYNFIKRIVSVGINFVFIMLALLFLALCLSPSRVADGGAPADPSS